MVETPWKWIPNIRKEFGNRMQNAAVVQKYRFSVISSLGNVEWLSSAIISLPDSTFPRPKRIYRMVNERLNDNNKTKITFTNTCFPNFFITLFGNIINRFFSVLRVNFYKLKFFSFYVFFKPFCFSVATLYNAIRESRLSRDLIRGFKNCEHFFGASLLFENRKRDDFVRSFQSSTRILRFGNQKRIKTETYQSWNCWFWWNLANIQYMIDNTIFYIPWQFTAFSRRKASWLWHLLHNEKIVASYKMSSRLILSDFFFLNCDNFSIML